MNIRLFIGGVLFCVGLCIASTEGPNAPGLINLLGLGIFGVGCWFINIGGKALKHSNKRR